MTDEEMFLVMMTTVSTILSVAIFMFIILI